jgi:hypothetical protein
MTNEEVDPWEKFDPLTVDDMIAEIRNALDPNGATAMAIIEILRDHKKRLVMKNSWFWAGRSVRYVRNCTTGVVRLQVRGQGMNDLWQDMTEDELRSYTLAMRGYPP